MNFDRKHLSDHELISIYRHLLLPRKIEEKMLLLLRQGKISKWFSAWGQEAISVAAVLALEEEEFILPMHRNLGVFTARELPLAQLFAQFQGKKEGFTKGRDRSFHFGSIPHHIVGMISHLGPQLAIADGIALANKLSQKKQVTLAFSGDGASSEGDFHEALNIAAVWQLPVIFVIEHNGYGLSTPSTEQYHNPSFQDKAKAYGIDSVVLDGNNILEMLLGLRAVAEDIREHARPFLVEAITYRMRGHEEASGTDYIPGEYLEEGRKKDPILNFENFLLSTGILSQDEKDKIGLEIKSQVDQAWQIADAYPQRIANVAEELEDIYKPLTISTSSQSNSPGKAKNMRMVDAISESLAQSMEKWPQLILMGQDIADYGGVFKVTKGFVETYGKDRVRNTPLCESAVIGTALGLSIQGYKAMVEMQFADFVSCGFNQIVNNLAKLHYRWGQHADVVIRLPTGAGVGAGPFHSQSTEAWFFHIPGLKIIYPSTPAEAKGLLVAAIEDPNPCLFFEHKALYRSLQGMVPTELIPIPIGKGNLIRTGSELTIITYGMGVHWAMEALDQAGIEADLIDLRTLLPWDKDMVSDSIKKTNKAIVLHEDSLTGGIGAEIAAWISENCFEQLDAPVMREASIDSPVPFATALEGAYLPIDRFKKKLLALRDY